MDFLFVYGIPDDQSGKVKIDHQGNSSIVLSGSCNISPFLQELPGNLRLFGIDSANYAQHFQLNYWPNVIFNEISDPDSHSVALRRCDAFCRQQQKPVINHPARILATRRDLIAKQLQGIKGLVLPKTIRLCPKSPSDVANAIRAERLSYPVIFRQAGDHGGVSTTLITTESEITASMHQYALDGRAFYATEFVDYRSGDGLYRKYRIVVVGGKPYLRHMIVSDSWLIHSSSRQFMQAQPLLRHEEAQQINTFEESLAPKIASCIAAISSELQLDYFGIDCHISNNHELLAFEINANMNVMLNNNPSPNIWQKPIKQIKQHLLQMICARAEM